MKWVPFESYWFPIVPYNSVSHVFHTKQQSESLNTRITHVKSIILPWLSNEIVTKNIAGMEKMSCESDTVNKIGSNKALFPSLVSILGCANCEIKIDYFLSFNFTLKIGCYDDNLFAIIFVLSTSKIILRQL